MAPYKAFLSISVTNLASGGAAALTNSLNVASCTANGNVPVSGGNVTAQSVSYSITFSQAIPYTASTYEYLISAVPVNQGTSNNTWSYSVSSVTASGFNIRFNQENNSGTAPSRWNIFVVQF